MVVEIGVLLLVLVVFVGPPPLLSPVPSIRTSSSPPPAAVAFVLSLLVLWFDDDDEVLEAGPAVRPSDRNRVDNSLTSRCARWSSPRTSWADTRRGSVSLVRKRKVPSLAVVVVVVVVVVGRLGRAGADVKGYGGW